MHAPYATEGRRHARLVGNYRMVGKGRDVRNIMAQMMEDGQDAVGERR